VHQLLDSFLEPLCLFYPSLYAAPQFLSRPWVFEITQHRKPGVNQKEFVGNLRVHNCKLQGHLSALLETEEMTFFYP